MGKWERIVLVLFILGAAPSARADSKADVEKLVRAHMAATVGKQGAMFDTLPPSDGDYWIADASGSYFSLFVDCMMDRKSSSACDSETPLFGSSWIQELKYSGIKVSVHVDDAAKVATFYATGTVSGSLSEEGMDLKGKAQMRVAGLAKQTKQGWKVVGAKHSAAVSDADLVKHGERLVGNVFTPKPGIEQEVASWFGHLAEHQGASAIGANGTAPKEVATTAAAMTKLAKVWDKMDLKPLDFTVHEEGDYAFVNMTVEWTAKKTDLTFDVGFVIAKEGGAWKWEAINFGPNMLTEYSFH